MMEELEKIKAVQNHLHNQIEEIQEQIGELRTIFLKIYDEPVKARQDYPNTDIMDYAQRIRNMAMDGVNKIRPVEMPPFN